MASQTGTLQEGQVRAMFDRIAGVYDRMNAVMTAGLDRRWRARAADLAAVAPGDRVLDVATGTGDLALELADRVAPGGEVVGADFAEAMLARARGKAAGRPDLRFEWGDALALDYPDELFDFYQEHGIGSVGFNPEEVEGPHTASSLQGEDMPQLTNYVDLDPSSPSVTYGGPVGAVVPTAQGSRVRLSAQRGARGVDLSTPPRTVAATWTPGRLEGG